MIRFKHRGSFINLEKFFVKSEKIDFTQLLARYGNEGVQALSKATPTETGETANSWSYEIVTKGDKVFIYWTNSNVNDGVNIAVILQYGHGTRNGGYVQGVDYINPAIVPIFERIAEDAWREVTAK